MISRQRSITITAVALFGCAVTLLADVPCYRLVFVGTGCVACEPALNDGECILSYAEPPIDVYNGEGTLNEPGQEGWGTTLTRVCYVNVGVEGPGGACNPPMNPTKVSCERHTAHLSGEVCNASS